MSTIYTNLIHNFWKNIAQCHIKKNSGNEVSSGYHVYKLKTHENPVSIKKAKQTNEIYTSTRLQKPCLS